MTAQLEWIALGGAIVVVIASTAALIRAWILVGGLAPDRPFRRVLAQGKTRTTQPLSRPDVVSEALRVAATAAGASMKGAVIASVARVAAGLSPEARSADTDQILDEIKATLREEVARRNGDADGATSPSPDTGATAPRQGEAPGGDAGRAR
jgi:hypothetical protein